MPDLTFHWNDTALRELLEGSYGGVAHDLERRAVAVESAAKVNASGRPGPRVQTGRLRSSITHALGHDGQGLYADIGSSVEYARFVELGTSHAPPYEFLQPALRSATD